MPEAVAEVLEGFLGLFAPLEHREVDVPPEGLAHGVRGEDAGRGDAVLLLYAFEELRRALPGHARRRSVLPSREDVVFGARLPACGAHYDVAFACRSGKRCVHSHHP